MWKPRPRSAASACARAALALAAIALPLLAGSALAQPVFTKNGGGTFSNVTTPFLLNDATGAFKTQGTVPCQAPETGQLTSPSGVCMQYTPSIPFIGGAAAIFGLKGALTDYVSPPLTTTGDTPAGSTTMVVTNDASLSNISQNASENSVPTLSTLATSVLGALPAGETIVSASTVGQNSVLTLSSPTLADLPAGSAVTFTTATGAQQFSALAASADLTAHQAAGGQAWAANFVVEAEPGSSGLIHGIEIDAANFSLNTGGFGVWLGNNGNQNMNVGFYVGPGVNNKGWLYGMQSVSAVNDDVLSTSSANVFTADQGTHSVGSYYSGTYSTAILQAVNPKGATPSARALFTITPVGGIVDSSPFPVGATSGSVQVAPQGSTGIILVCSGTLASLTVTLPPNALPKQTFHIASECNITSLTLGTQPPGGTILGGATSITPSTPMTFVFDNDRLLWLRW
ncbi:hypothetical protein [Lichenicoccus sp.]|uniref:hypothetical protein n=1 Tax=Lichenicoccus sp. TaxID=2781899 RepID=UPI003D0F1849